MNKAGIVVANYSEQKRSNLNSKLWASGNEADKEIARKQKRRLHYIANILVVSDPKHPEKEGSVFLFKFGKKIFEKIMDKARPTFEDEEPVQVFDPFEGANFKLRQRKVEGYPNYDQSAFLEVSPLANSDEKILEILNKQYNVKEFLDPKNFKSYDVLARKLALVLGDGSPLPSAAESLSNRSEPAQNTSQAAPFVTDDDDDTMAYFNRIANED